jgi:DNA-binding transcriptional MerR regulator
MEKYGKISFKDIPFQKAVIPNLCLTEIDTQVTLRNDINLERMLMEENMLIGEVCRQADCTPRTVRHYETEKIIASITITPGGRKRYSKDTVSIIRTARLLKRLGYSLKDIRKIINLTRSRDTKHRRLTKRIRKMLSESLSSIDSELELLTASRRKIADLLGKTEKCQSCTALDCKECGELKDLRTLGLLEG